MPSLNSVSIIGNLGKNPEMRFSPAGTPVSNFSVAVNHRYKKSDGDYTESTEWFAVATWGKSAEWCNQNLSKGDLVFVEGRLQLNTWDGNDGQKHSYNEITASNVQLLDKRGERVEEKVEELEDPEDLPF